MILSTILLCSGCNEVELQGPLVFNNNLYILFENESGENLMLGMDCEEDEQLIKNPDAEFSEYYKRHVLSEYYTIRLTGKHIYGHEEAVYNPKRLGYTWLDNKAYANFSFVEIGDKAGNMGIIIRCEHVFGDKEEHVVSADFGYVPDKPSQADCVRFTLDGVEYPVSPGGRVTVQLGR